MNQSELLQSKVVEAHDEVWKKILGVRSHLPSPYSTVLGLCFTILSVDELIKFREKPEFQFSITDPEFLNLITEYNLDLIRPYIDERLWAMARGRISFAFRLLTIFSSESKSRTGLDHWPEDKLVVEHLRTAFSNEELERFSYSTIGTFREILDLWESRIATEIRKALLE